MKNSLWKLKKEKVNKTNLFRYSNFVSKKFKINFHNDFNELWKWSINNKIDFWESVWKFSSYAIELVMISRLTGFFLKSGVSSGEKLMLENGVFLQVVL